MTLSLELESAGRRASRIERRFLGWSEPFLPAVAADLARAYTGSGELRLEGALVVVPGGRAGRRLKELLLVRADHAGVRLVPPRIVTVGSLPELLYAPELPLASEAVAGRAWVMALRELSPAQLRVIVPDAPDASDLVGWTRMAAGVAALHREVAGGGWRFEDVADRCDDGTDFSDAARWRVLAEAQASYRRILESLGATDPGLARIGALAAGSVAHPGGDVWLAGVADMPRLVKSMLRALGADGPPIRSLVHAPPETADAFDDLGCVVASAWSDRRVPLTADTLVVTGRPADQADEVLGVLARLGGRYAPEEISIAVPDEEVLPFLEQRLSSAGVPARRATGAKVARTPAARLLAAIADYLDGHRYDACAALARHPDLWRWIRRAPREGRGAGAAFSRPGGWIEALDEHFGRRLPTRIRARSVEGTHATASVVGAFCRLIDDRRLLGGLDGSRPISEWMPAIIDLLLAVYGEEPLDRAIPAERELLDALSSIRDAAADLHRLPAAADERCDGATAIRLLLDAAGPKTLTPRADDAAVELLGWLELHLDDAPVTVVTGLNEGVLPESVNAHAYLPDALRARLGLLDNETRYARDAYQITALIHSRAEVKVIAGRRTVRGDPLRPSRLIFAVEGAALAERVRRFYGEEGVESRTPGDGEDVLPGSAEPSDRPAGGGPAPAADREDPGVAAGDSGFRLPPEPELVVPSPIERLSVSRFGAVLTNPYLFALETLLGLRSLDDEATELDGLGFGNLAHQVLERFGNLPELAESTDPDRIALELDGILDRLMDARFGSDALPAVRFQGEQMRARLRAFARWQARWTAAGWRIVGAECTTPEGGVPLIVDGEPFPVTGRIDRIDHNTRTGEWAIFDYKTGDAGDPPDRTHRSGRGAEREWKDLQLPLYRHILPHVRDPEGRHPFTGGNTDDALLGYILLPRDAGSVGESFADWSREDLAEADEAAADVVRMLRTGRFVHDPAAGPPPRDRRLAALLGLGYLESALVADDGVTDDE